MAETTRFIENLANTFEKGSNTQLFVCDADMAKIKKELAELNSIQTETGHFKNEKAIELGTVSYYFNGRTINVGTEKTFFKLLNK